MAARPRGEEHEVKVLTTNYTNTSILLRPRIVRILKTFGMSEQSSSGHGFFNHESHESHEFFSAILIIIFLFRKRLKFVRFVLFVV